MKYRRLMALALFCGLLCASCSSAVEPPPKAEPTAASVEEAPEIPARLPANADGVPMLRVYVNEARVIREMDAETYLLGVLTGEMRNDWPLEALKAQAILARTFVMQFVSEKRSKYEGADISTDVSEAQAYNAEDINENVRKAVKETRGLVLARDGSLIHAWFHAHAGGRTELPSVGLDYKGGDPDYIVPVDSPDSPDAPDEARRWQARFSAAEVGRACAEAGVSTGDAERVAIEARGASGRVKTFSVNGKSVSGPALRIHLGADRLRSTLIDRVEKDGDAFVFSGRGFGHGVGMSQWGAYALAKDGASAEEIVRHYFRGIDLVRMWW